MTALVVRVHNFVANLRDREEGQTMAEYALILGLIAVFVILMIFFLGGEIKNIFERTGSSVQNAPDGL
jgi:Flp pilus assembly pilin Flp